MFLALLFSISSSEKTFGNFWSPFEIIKSVVESSPILKEMDRMPAILNNNNFASSVKLSFLKQVYCFQRFT